MQRISTKSLNAQKKRIDFISMHFSNQIFINIFNSSLISVPSALMGQDLIDLYQV